MGNGVRAQVEAIGSYELVLPNGLVICLDNCHYAPIITRGKMTRKPFPHRTERVTDLLGITHTDVGGPLRHVSRQGYPKETMGYYFYFPPKKIVVARYAEFLKKNILSQEISGRAKELEEIQYEDTSPFENTSDIPTEVEGFEPPQKEVVPIRRSTRTHRALDRLCLNVEVEDQILRDLNEPINYKAAILDLEYDKWVDAMNAKIQSMKDNQVWRLADLPPNYLEETAFILEIKIYQDRSKRLIRLSQSAYMDKILKRYRMDNSKRGYIHMQEKLDLNKTHGALTPKKVKRMQNVPYASIVESIMYAVRCTRPDDMFLVYGGNPKAELPVDCYCDVRFKTDRDDTKSHIGYVFILNRGIVDWKSSKQSTTAMSATDSEYIAAPKVGMEVVWIRKFILGLGESYK
nr:hypothetical protein [Tanacetum cinerariifolium]